MKFMENEDKENLTKQIIEYLDTNLLKKEFDVENIADFFLELKKELEEKKLDEVYGLIGNIYFLNKDNMEKFICSKNTDFLFLLEKFYAKSGFLEFYLLILERIKGVVSKNNLLFLLSKEFLDLGFKIENYIQYLKDGNEYLELEKEGLLEYEIFREIFHPFTTEIVYNNSKKISQLLIFFENMAQSPDKYVKTLLVDTVIEGGWLEKDRSFESYIKNFGDKFLILYALVYDGRIFLKNEAIWKEVKRRNLKI